jgi:DNA-directed RNA polymerase subunit RPC12/RpoP
MEKFVKTFENFGLEDLYPHGMTHQMEEPHMEIDHDDHHEAENYMFFGNLETLHRLTGILLEMDPMKVDHILKNGHNWAADHVATSKDDIEEVANFFINEMNEDSVEEQLMEEAYMCEGCGCMYEAHEVAEDMSCNECGGPVILVGEG